VSEITVVKCDSVGREVFRWKAKVLERGEQEILVEAHFGLENHFMGDIPLEPGDRFVESYYTDRWCNIFEVHSREADQLKCWYGNLSYPAEFGAEKITFRDLALDLLVRPDGRQELLDREEFENLVIPAEDRAKVLAELEKLKNEFRERLAK
jgi:hypothetical protein